MKLRFTNEQLDEVLLRVIAGDSSQTISKDIGKSESWVKMLRVTERYKARRAIIVEILRPILPTIPHTEATQGVNT